MTMLRRLLIDDVALQIRNDAGRRAAAHAATTEERLLLLSYVVWPTPQLSAASTEAAIEELLELRQGRAHG